MKSANEALVKKALSCAKSIASNLTQKEQGIFMAGYLAGYIECDEDCCEVIRTATQLRMPETRYDERKQ